MQDCQSTDDIQAKLKRLFARTIEQMLETEMNEYLVYDKHSVEGKNSGNSRNGYSRMTIIIDYGESEVAIPRDRNGAFEPKLVEKRFNCGSTSPLSVSGYLIFALPICVCIVFLL